MAERYGYYPGCSLHGTGAEYDESTRRVCRDLEIELAELDDWNCCGASSAHATSHLLALALSARNLSIAETAKLDVVAPCAMCFSRMKASQAALAKGGALAKDIREAAGVDVLGSSRVVSIPEVFLSLPEGAISSRVKRPLTGLKVACYYGCLLVRPVELGIDDAENPTVLDRLVESVGATGVDWPHKTECCGGSMSITRTDVVETLAGRLLKAAKAAGADCIAVACPMCHVNLDMRQAGAERTANMSYNLPVVYITQLIGLAFGHKEAELGLDRHFVSALGVDSRATGQDAAGGGAA